jgi:polysaccharide pyruvyl transferase WcaK-like protein
MRILLDTALNEGSAEYLNMGDVSMLQVAVTRLKRLWPSAIIEVLTESPENLAKYCPGTTPLLRAGRDLWIGDRDGLHSFLFTRLYKHLPEGISYRLREGIGTLELKWPKLLTLMIRLRPLLGDGGGDFKGRLIGFLETMENADLFVVCGAGGFADDCRRWNWSTLNTLEAVIRHRIPVVMLGQGMGPLSDPEVLSKAKTVLPEVRLITLRGGRGGLALLESLGVDTSQVLTTGDEAIELAYEARSQELGQGLGINLRVASYAEIQSNFIEKLRPVLQEFARRHNAPMIPVPIAFHPWANDQLTIQQLLTGLDDQSDGGSTLDTPLKIIKQVGRCRVVVTGAYHAAVFALAQGIPVVCLAKSPYYVAKFLGLQDQFGRGCEIIFLNEAEVFEKLAEAIDRTWQSAELMRRPLQEAALRQIQLSWGAYEQVRDLLDSHRAQTRIGTQRVATTRHESAGVRLPN